MGEYLFQHRYSDKFEICRSDKPRRLPRSCDRFNLIRSFHVGFIKDDLSEKIWEKSVIQDRISYRICCADMTYVY